ncbi:GH25 family lysozyme [Sphingomonas sp. AX6]|uniref:GH25 family lysozyme n=1 Tax=Sphingomonas sp. AX6 TaxID=2653171 RepID=UPI0012EFEE00|nr:GH25 family lysozyme [Sphingomonas sp. AX6]VXC99048.1 Lysozyme [Sphingomonas sp. AX6]
MRIWHVIALAVASFGLIAAACWTYATGWEPDRTRFPVQGVDVSAANQGISWDAVRANGATFAYIVATQGARARDAAFQSHWEGAYMARLRRGAIHRYSLCDHPRAQATNFMATVPRTTDQLPAIVEFAFDEQCAARPNREALLDDVASFLTTAEAHLGKPMLIAPTEPFEDEYALSEGIARPIRASSTWLEPNYLPRAWTLWRASTLKRIDGVDGPLNWNAVAQ